MTDHGPLTTEAALAVLLDRTEAQGKTLDSLARTLSDVHTTFVPRTEWMQRNVQVDERHQADGREIATERADRQRADDAIRAELRAELTSRRHPWPTVVGSVAALVALALSIVNYVAN